MRPTDPRLRRQLAPAARPLTGMLVAGGLGAVLVIVQAWAVTGLLVAAVRREELATWAVTVAAVFAARALTGWVGDLLAARSTAIVGTHLRRQVVAAVLRRREVRSADAVLLTRGVAAAEPYLTRYLPAVVLAGALPLLTLGVIAWLDPLSGLVVLLTLPLVPVFGALVGLATRDRAEEQWRAMASLSGHFLDVVRGLPTLVAHRRARAQSATIGRVTDRYRRASMATLRVAFASSAVLELVATLSVALVAVVVGTRLAGGGLDLHTALLVLLLAPEAYWPLRRVGAEFHAAAEGVATFEQVDELLAGTPAESIGTPAAAGTALVATGLTVRHPGRTVPALDGVDVVVPARGVTVVTGPSGCGKSTLLAALVGLVPPTDGQVLVDGVPVAGEAWRSQVAWVSQRPVFVAGTVADNLRLARPEATDADLWAALRAVALEERVRALPWALRQPLGEDGVSLSAGERARLALARVVLARRPWVFLDEPTAHLDALTEQVIADTVVELGRTSAVVVVAHRPALVALADHVIELSAPTPRAAVSHPPVVVPERWTAHRSPEPAADRPPRGGLLGSTVLGALASLSGVALTATAGWLIVQASTHPPVLTLMVAIVGVRTFGLARPVLRYVERLRSHDLALRLLARRRVEVYDALVPLVPGRLGRRRGDLLASVVDDVDGVVDDALRVRLPLMAGAVVVAGATVVSTALLPAAGAVVAAVGLVGGGLAFGLARLGAGTAERAAVGLRADLSEAAVETAQVAPELVMWQAEATAVSRVAELSDRLGRTAARAVAWSGAARAVVLVVCGIGVAAVAAVATGQVSGPVLALLALVPLALADILTTFADAGALSVRTRAAAARLHALERTRPAVRATVGDPPPARHDLVLDRVTAGWTPDRIALRDLSLGVDRGERVVVVGPSGSGKSTLAALLLRFLDPVAGDVRLGGVATTRLDPDDVRRVVGLVDDDPHVFASTLVENVRLARPDASDADVEAALRRARLGTWLDDLPDGLHTWLGDGHAQVSGGERARIAVARSLLAEQPILVLDEPTAHLDHATAVELAHEVLDPRGERAVVWISHDHVGVDLADAVVDLGAVGARVPQR
ncbi:thiol reductant ABC exporter subunit CydD [Nocardioides lianchengensis]|uniref:ATP-binding cassette, subfamily C, CydCD n=1 Tax=Nocardioides lianchengensis TaxID=1045774 RepID=A0A1G6JCI4_9ACTN|nr:thiol reductant ABC exporter subunit CydD [Nocardioides lianchengensis]NYG12786.1 ATP-binding cassette subfamily C protein CydCD [Nocardioides lianchengensis]SDC16400.1 ATP-binding cassette, subfamily C, CydCD [Nocardioides lianchengensis]